MSQTTDDPLNMVLTGAELDVLYKLGKHGGQEDGGLPSKNGMAGLISKGLAYKDHAPNLTGHCNFITEAGMALYESITEAATAADL